jgi:hypothetical protein
MAGTSVCSQPLQVRNDEKRPARSSRRRVLPPLETRTEGWIAGPQMVVLAMRDHTELRAASPLHAADSCEPGQKFIVDSSRIHRARLMSFLMETYDGQDQRSLAPVSGGHSHQGRPLPRPCGPSFSPSHLPAGERIGKP